MSDCNHRKTESNIATANLDWYSVPFVRRPGSGEARDSSPGSSRAAKCPKTGRW